MVAEVQDLLGRLNDDGSFAGPVARFARLVADLPADFCETEVVTAVGADDQDPTIVIRPGPNLKALALAFRALDFHELESPSEFRVTMSEKARKDSGVGEPLSGMLPLHQSADRYGPGTVR